MQTDEQMRWRTRPPRVVGWLGIKWATYWTCRSPWSSFSIRSIRFIIFNNPHTRFISPRLERWNISIFSLYGQSDLNYRWWLPNFNFVRAVMPTLLWPWSLIHVFLRGSCLKFIAMLPSQSFRSYPTWLSLGALLWEQLATSALRLDLPDSALDCNGSSFLRQGSSMKLGLNHGRQQLQTVGAILAKTLQYIHYYCVMPPSDAEKTIIRWIMTKSGRPYANEHHSVTALNPWSTLEYLHENFKTQ